MEEEPKNIWKKSLKMPGLFLLWLILLVATTLIFSAILLVIGEPFHSLSDLLKTFIASLFIATAMFCLWLFIRWIFQWRNFKRFLFGFACFATLIALFYAEEDWRGKHDWEKFKREQEAKGENFDWQSTVPAAVPDDENFAFSPVWIAEEKYNFLNTLKRAEAWYGDRIYSDEVTKFFPLLPVYTSTVTGTNMWLAPQPPENSGTWASGDFFDLKLWQSYYRNLSKTNPAAEIIVAPQPQSPAQDVLLALSKFDPVFEQLRQDGARPYSRFPLQYDSENPAVILLPHLAALKRSTMVLQLRAVAELQNNQSAAALSDVRLMLRLVDSVRTEPFLISHLVRIAILNLALQPVWEGLAEHKWSDAQLAGLDSELGELDFLADYQLVVHGESVFSSKEVAYLQNHGKVSTYLDFDNSNHSHGNEPLDLMVYAFPAGWFHQNQIGLSKFYIQKALPLVDLEHRTVSPEMAEQVDSDLEAEIQRQTPYNLIEGIILLPIKTWFSSGDGYTFVKKFAYAQASVNLARVAIALERYRLAHGEFPESLDVLAPKFITELPHDVIGGGPLHYRRTSDGQFVLYSIGWDETDDGGVVVFKKGSTPDVDIDQGDWVWKYPAGK